MTKRLFLQISLLLAIPSYHLSTEATNIYPDAPLSRFTFTEPHMGTRFKITVYARDEDTAKSAAKAAYQRIADLDGIMTDYRSTSELMRLCQKAGGEPIRVSDDLFR